MAKATVAEAVSAARKIPSPCQLLSSNTELASGYQQTASSGLYALVQSKGGAVVVSSCAWWGHGTQAGTRLCSQ